MAGFGVQDPSIRRSAPVASVDEAPMTLAAVAPQQQLGLVVGATTIQTLTMYQGEDWSRTLSFFSDVAQTQPLVFSAPYMDIRDDTTRYATLDTTGTQEGTASTPTAGQLLLVMAYAKTALIPQGTYNVDVFATVSAKRKAILKQGYLQLIVLPRRTQEA